MFDRIEDLLNIILSLMVALTTLVGVLEKLLTLWQEVYEDESEVAKRLEKDIVRLQSDLEQQGQQLEALKTHLKKG